MVLNCVRICLARGSGIRTIFYGAGSSSCKCDVKSQFTRGLQTSGSSFQLNAATKTKDDPVKSSSLGEEKKSSQSSLREMYERQKKRILEAPEESEPHLIYKGVLAGSMKRVKVLSMTTSIAGLAMQPILIQQAGELPFIGNVAIFGFVGFFTFGTPLLIHSAAKKYVTEIMYNPHNETYTASTYTFFLQKRKVDFKIEDITIPEVPGLFTTFNVKSQEGKIVPLFVAPESFIKHNHYGKMMGYDKPIDLHLSTPETENADVKTVNNSQSKKL